MDEARDPAGESLVGLSSVVALSRPEPWLWAALFGAGGVYALSAGLQALGLVWLADAAQVQVVATLGQQALLLAVMVWAARHAAGDLVAALHLGRCSRRWLLTGWLLPLPLFPVLLVVSGLWRHGLRLLGRGEVENPFFVLLQSLDRIGWVLLVGGAILLAPLVEEILFRRVLFGVLAAAGGTLAATLATAAVFATLHFSVSQWLPLFVFGLVLQWLVTRSGSLWPAIAAHALHNAIVIAVICRPWPLAMLGHG